MSSIEQTVKEAENRLLEAGIEEAAYDAKQLFLFLMQWNTFEYTFHRTEEVPAEIEQQYEQFVQRRALREPLQYITNEQNFYGRDFYVDNRVLIPRFDTEILVETMLEMLDNHAPLTILDMCTGSGCIAITLALELPHSKVTGIDISTDSLQVASKNNLQLNANVDFYESDLYDKVEGTFDVLVSNPPYIKSQVVKEDLLPEVKDHEPRLALDGKEDGLWFYEKLIEQGKKYVKPEGYLFFEIGYDEGNAVSDMLMKCGWHDVTVKKDYKGLDRVVYARRH